MLYAYIYPVEIPRNTSDKKLLRLYAKTRKVVRLTPDELAERINDEQLDDVHHWIRFIDDGTPGRDGSNQAEPV